MRKKVFTLNDSEDIDETEIKNNKGNSYLPKLNKKKKNLKHDSALDNISVNKSVLFEEQENIEFILMDFKQPEELNKFRNMKSLTLVQQNISSLKVINK